MSVFLILAACGWIAWAAPVCEVDEAGRIDGGAFWLAVSAALLACAARRAAAAVAMGWKND